MVETVYSAISRGTERLVHQGRVPRNQYDVMRAPFQEGSFPGPVKYGYANVGRVVSGPPDMVTKPVFCLYPHQTGYVVPCEAVVALPEAVPEARAVLAANMETALNAVWDGSVLQDHRAAVVGAGVVGCLVAHLLRKLVGCDVEMFDVDPAKGAVAGALELPLASPEAATGEFERVFHASGSEAGLRTALSIAAFEAEIIELSWYGDREVQLPLGESFHSRRLVIRSSQVGHVAPACRTHLSRRDRLARALELLSDPALDVLISGESCFDDLPDVMPRIIGQADGVMCHRIRYAEEASLTDNTNITAGT